MRILFFTALLLPVLQLKAQNSDTLYWRPGAVYGLDTVALVHLDEAVVSTREGLAAKYQKRYSKIQRKVLKVYPYAHAAGKLMREYEKELSQLKTERERKRYISKAEDELKEEFEGEIRNMTISEGLILIKLIDRETGDTSYELIKELRGSFSAFLWQSVARLFGSNLKEDYDPELEDRIIEDVVQRIERGEITVPEREVKPPKSRKKKRF